MNALKRIPIRYFGELHDIELLNFSVDLEEVKPMVPQGIAVRDFNGRALISMVNVSLRKMHPSFVPEFLNFNYRHVAFRLLVDDSVYNDGTCKGIFFLRSFTDQQLIVWGGRQMTDYNLEKAFFQKTPESFLLKQGSQLLEYRIGGEAPQITHPELLKTVGLLDRAYAMRGKDLLVTQILREKWPLEEVNITNFQTNFFRSARLEGCFRVNETIYYQWKPAKKVNIKG